LFISSNRGKRSLAIDVKSEAGREVLAKLVRDTDVLVQNFRPGTMERLGLGADELRGPASAADLRFDQRRRRDRPVCEEAGLRSDHPGPFRLCGHPVAAGDKPPQMIRTIVCDKTTAVMTAQAVAAALYAREKDGRAITSGRDARCDDCLSLAGRA
jgi:hypothetical protein